MAILVVVASVVPSVVMGMPGVPAGAQEQGEIVAGAGDLTSASEARLLELIDKAEVRREQIESEAAGVNQEVQNLQSSLNAAEQHLGALQSRQWTLEHRLGALNRDLAAARERRARLAIDAYTGRESAASLASTLLHADDLSALAARRSYVHLLGSSQAENLASEERMRDEVADLLEELDGVRREMRTKQQDRSADAEQVEHREQVAANLVEQAAAEVDERDALFEEARSRQEEFEEQLDELSEQSEEVTQILRARRGLSGESGASEESAAASGGELAHPLPGRSLGSAFGPRVHPIFGSVRMHTGVDIGAPFGEAIHAAEDGVVVSAGWRGGYGRAVVIDHGGGLATLYAHQSEIAVVGGERVSRGQVIGRVGCTGTCAGDHLHFEVRRNGVPVRPNPYVGG